MPVRRLGAVALAIMTFAIAFVLDLIAFDYEPIAKGSLGWTIRSPTLDIPGVNQVVDWIVPDSQDKLDLSNPAMQVVAFLALFGLFVLVLHSLQRSATGRAMLAVRSTEVAARTSGISPAHAKTLIFALSAGIAGFGGVLLGIVNFSVGRTTAPPLIGLVWLAVAVTFGIRRPGGALLAGLSFVCTTTIFTWIGDDYLSGSFKDLTTSTQFTAILFGLGAINLAKNPDGLLALIGHQRIERRVDRERKARIAEAEAAAHGGEIPEHERTSDDARGAGDAPAARAVRSRRATPVAEAALATRRRRRRLRRGRGAPPCRSRGRAGHGRRAARCQRRRQVDAVRGRLGARRAHAGTHPPGRRGRDGPGTLRARRDAASCSSPRRAASSPG